MVILPRGELRRALHRSGRWYAPAFFISAPELAAHRDNAAAHHTDEHAGRIDEHAAFRAIVKRYPRFRLWRVLLVLAVLLFAAAAAHAQNPNLNIDRVGGVKQASDTLKVNCVAGCASSGGGTASSVSITDGSNSALKLAIDSLGRITLANSGFSISNFPALQAVSSTQLPTALDASGFLKTHEQGTANVNVTNGSMAVTGTFWPATQPVSIASMPSTPVTGTFWQATQPISGSVSVSNFPATQPVSGTITANAGTGTMATSSAQLPAALDASGFFKTHEQGTATVTGTVTDNQGAANTIANAWPTKITDGTNTVAVKAASTAATATDTSIVVQESPNMSDPCSNPAVAKSSSVISLASTTATAIVALVSAKTVAVCAIHMTLAGTTPSALFSSAATCGSSPTNLTGTMAPTTGSFLTFGYGGTIFKNTASQNLCLTLGGTSPSAQGVLTYVQQ